MTRSVCPRCGERSLIRKAYTAKIAPNEIRVVEFCVIPGCKYKEAWVRPTGPESDMPENIRQAISLAQQENNS